MKLPHRRHFLHLAAGVAALPAASRNARAQTYPSRPVRIVVGLPAGSAPDIGARLIAQRLSERLAQQFIVDNRPGANTNIGTEAVVRAAPDGYTLLLHRSERSQRHALRQSQLQFRARHRASGGLVRVPHVMEVHPSVQPKRFPSSSRMPRPTPASSTWRPAALGARPTSPASFSR